MTCHEIQDLLLTDMLDAELSADKKKAVDDHLAACPVCREVLAVARQLEGDLKLSPSVQPPAYLWDRIREKIESAPASLWDGIQVWWEEVLAGFRPAFVNGSLVTATLVLLVVFVPYLSQRGQGMASSAAVEISSLAYLDDSGEVASEAGESGYGSASEYFL
jgi:anti-sigma factor RsiW